MKILHTVILEWSKDLGIMSFDSALKIESKQKNGWRIPSLLELQWAIEDKVTGFVRKSDSDYWVNDGNAFGRARIINIKHAVSMTVSCRSGYRLRLVRFKQRKVEKIR